MLSLRWNGLDQRRSSCPVCGLAGLKARILEVLLPSAAGGDHTTDFLRCSECHALYADPVRITDYVDADRHGLKFYLEQGAGIRTMLEPLALLDSRPIRQYLEIGCGFGFVMDYVRRMLGWQVRGFDPGFIANSGRQQLQLPIENAYFTGLNPGEDRVDLLFCSEVIEHITDPTAFLANICGALSPNGILLLTTPNGDALSRDLPGEYLFPLLSPGQHVILYGREAMATLLRRAGLPHLRILDDGHQLRVAASVVPFDGSSPHFSQALYQRYLAEAAAAHDTANPLGAGLVCRLMKEEVGQGHYAAAQALYLRLRDGYFRQYRIDIEAIDPDDLRRLPESGFSEFNEAWPCNLTGVWHSRGVIQLVFEQQPTEAIRSFSAAIYFGAALRRRLRAMGADDPETAVLARDAQIARLRTLAHCDPETALTAWEELANEGKGDPELAKITERARHSLFSHLTLLGHYALAERLLADSDLPVAGVGDPGGDPLPSFEDGESAFAWGLFSLNHRCDYSNAAAAFATAAAVFGRVWQHAKESNADPTLLWRARFHQGLATSLGGDTASARFIATEINNPPPGSPTVPDEIRLRLGELAAPPASADPPVADKATRQVGKVAAPPKSRPATKWKVRFKRSPITIADRAQAAGQWPIAAQHYSKALKRNPARPPIWVQYGHALKEMGKLSEAEGAYRQAIAYEAANWDAWWHLGHILKLQAQDEQAAAAYLTAFVLAPQGRELEADLRCAGLLDAELAELRVLATATDARSERFRLIYVSGESHTPGHDYRVLRPMSAAAQAGAETAWMRADEIPMRQSELAAADAVIFWRAAWDDTIALGVKIGRENGAKIVFDIDDLLIDPALAKIDVIDGIRSHKFQEAAVQEEFSQLRTTLLASDVCLTTTEELADHIRRAGRPALVLPNGFDHRSLKAARLAAQRRSYEPADALVRIGYATGSMTHQRDFAQCAAAVASVLREHPECRLVAFRRSEDARPILHIEEFSCLRGLEDRIEWRTYVPLAQLPNELARFDVNLAPLEIGNLFCEAKSELKFFEAALAGVATIASATGPFRRAVQHGETGFLATTTEDWQRHLSALVTDRALRERVAKAACRDVLWQFGPERRVQIMASVIDLLKGEKTAGKSFEEYSSTPVIFRGSGWSPPKPR